MNFKNAVMLILFGFSLLIPAVGFIPYVANEASLIWLQILYYLGQIIIEVTLLLYLIGAIKAKKEAKRSEAYYKLHPDEQKEKK